MEGDADRELQKVLALTAGGMTPHEIGDRGDRGVHPDAQIVSDARRGSWSGIAHAHATAGGQRSAGTRCEAWVCTIYASLAAIRRSALDCARHLRVRGAAARRRADGPLVQPRSRDARQSDRQYGRGTAPGPAALGESTAAAAVLHAHHRG